jgi:hypothetical protein
MRTLAPVSLVNHHRLVHQGLVHRHIENSIAEINAVDGIARLISDFDFHSVAA